MFIVEDTSVLYSYGGAVLPNRLTTKPSNRMINKRGNDVPLMKFRELFLKRVVVNQIDIRDVRLDQIHNETKL